MSVLKTPSTTISWGVFLLLTAAIFLAYLPSFGHGFLMDDESVVLQNPAVNDLRHIPELFRKGYFNFEGPRSELWKTYYRPLTSVSFALNRFFGGPRPWAYNALNLFLHSLVTFLIFRLSHEILKDTTAAFTGAFLYALHTANTEAVAYIASRSDVLAALFILLGLLAYQRGHRTAALVWQAAALLSKESSLLMPFYLLIFDTAFMGGGWKTRAKRFWPFFAVSAIYVVFRQSFCPVPFASVSDPAREVSLRVLSMSSAFLEYAKAVLWPEPFKFCLTLPLASDFHDGRVVATVFLAIFFVAALVWTWKRNRPGFFGLFFFAAAFLPYLEIVRFKPAWAEHYLYVPAIGLVVMFASAVKSILHRPERSTRVCFFGVYVVCLALLFHQTQVRNGFYKDPSVFYEKLSASDSPYAFYGDTRRAAEAMREGRWEKSGELLFQAEKKEPHSDTVHHLLGLYFFKQRAYPQALEHFEKAYEYSVVHDPRYRVRSAMTLFQLGRLSEASAIYEEIQKTNPKDVEVYTNLLMIDEMRGEPERARAWAELGLQNLKGNDADYTLLSMTLVRLAYRQGWDTVVHERLEILATQYPSEFWYSDIVRLLTGRDDPSRSLPALRAKYPGADFQSALRLYALMALVLNGHRVSLGAFLNENRTDLIALVEKQPLFKKELERAEKTLRSP